MFTYAQLKQFIEKNNIKHELRPIESKYEVLAEVDGKYQYVTETEVRGYFLGMNNIAGRKGQSEQIWTWFRFDCSELKGSEVAWFVERYSQNNGKSYTSISEELATEETISRRMNN